MRVYIAGAITGAPGWLLRWYEDLADALGKLGIESYVPHRDEPGALGSGVFRWDLEKIAGCDAIVATLSRPSTGTGIEMALHPEKPLVGIYHLDGKLSPFVKGFFRARRAPMLGVLDEDSADAAAEWVAERLGPGEGAPA